MGKSFSIQKLLKRGRYSARVYLLKTVTYFVEALIDSVVVVQQKDCIERMHGPMCTLPPISLSTLPLHVHVHIVHVHHLLLSTLKQIPTRPPLARLASYLPPPDALASTPQLRLHNIETQL